MKKEEVKNKEEKKTKSSKKDEKYFYSVGRRKRSVAQVRLYPNDKATENDVVVNGKEMKEYFPVLSLQSNFMGPLRESGMTGKFKVSVVVRGGGVTGQVEASRLGIARALVDFDEELKAVLKSHGFLTRDSRKVERKKPGLKKARRAPQFSKR
jgi:small subunit ribosomal protein S9